VRVMVKGKGDAERAGEGGYIACGVRLA